MVVIRGFGCNLSPQYLRDTAKKLMSEAHASITSVDVLCNPSTTNMAKDIGHTLLGRTMNTDTKFVLATAQYIADLAQRHKKVLLVGHSYGGSVVGRIVKILESNEAAKNKVNSATIGTIYIPTASAINHFMYTIDIAILCNKGTRRDKKQHVSWMAPPRRKGPITSHFEYNHILSNIAKHARVPSTYGGGPHPPASGGGVPRPPASGGGR
jgi:hypothetical protein